ncbi:MAG: hypothetical protein WED10_05700, partial [Brumimicrobium sp.]
MKKPILFTIVLLLFKFSFSQNQYLYHVNNQLREMFENVSFPNNDVLFLAERSANIIDSSYYSSNSPDTLNDLIWMQLYEEMYYAAHDTLGLNSVAYYNEKRLSFQGDTIPIGLMDVDYYNLHEDALNTGDYFTFDVNNDQLFDHPNPIGSPYIQNNIFFGSPLKQTSNYANPVFRIDPAFFITDSINISNYSNPQALKINFNDNTGWHSFDISQVSHYQPVYSTAGIKTIEIELRYREGATYVSKTSKSILKTMSKSMKKMADDLIKLPGLEIGVYNSCNETEGAEEKAIIYLEGIDLLDASAGMSRGVEQIYDEMIGGKSAYIDELRNFNYTYYVISWDNSRIDMRFNALYLLNFIEHLKSEYQESDEQFVIIGESMGGVIARYALTFMETEDYTYGNFSPFFVESGVPANVNYIQEHPEILLAGSANREEELIPLSHKTRSLITIDSPHQGANIPLSIQHAYKHGLNHIFPSSAYINNIYNIGLESYAAKQLLVYHLQGKTNPTQSISTYGPHLAHISFFEQLDNMGDYPEHCKLVALSNASLKGENQRSFNGEKTPGDKLLLFETSLYATLFWIFDVPMFQADLRMYTNPSSTGTIYNAAVGSFTIDISLELFGLDITHVYASTYSKNETAVDVKPYCVSAGGWYGQYFKLGENTTPGDYDLSKKWFFNLFSYDLTVQENGCVLLNSNAYTHWSSSINFNYSLCSDGFLFGFVPLQSALDYGSGVSLPLNHNIYDENISTKLDRTPFDVIIGYPEIFNEGHLNYRDPLIYNLTQDPSQNCDYQTSNGDRVYYDADLQNECEVRRSLLCLEIGDEEMYLENWSLDRTAQFHPQYDMHVNVRNPYYKYPTYSDSLEILGAYSKDNNFNILPSGYAIFKYDEANSPTGVGFAYNNFQSPSLWEDENTEMTICVVDYAQGKSYHQEDTTPSKEPKSEKYFKLYPNPNVGNILWVETHLEEIDEIQL